MKHISISELDGFERFYRANLINSLSGFKSLHLLGTYSDHEVANLGLFSNIVHLGADPALIGIVNRPKQASPHSISNIENNGVFTLNAVHKNWVMQAHQCSAKYELSESEFEAVGLRIEIKESINAPFVKESQIKYACQLCEIMPIKRNGTFFIIAEITDIFIENEDWIKPDGFIAHEKAESVTSLGLDAYYTTSLINRFSYAKKDKWPQIIL